MKQTAPEQTARLIRHGLAMGRLIILLLIAVLIALFFKFRLSTRIERDVLFTQARAENTERLLVDFMAKTVDRWDKLQNENPELNVPAVELPPISASPSPQK